MNIVNFTPLSGLIGGAIIGVGATLYLLTTGRIAGISGILKGITQKSQVGEKILKLLFVIGLIIGGFIFISIYGLSQSAISIKDIDTQLILAAIFVGIGTAFGNGCTSGHGICGLSRRSKRSIVATAIFMLFGMLTVFFIKG